MNKPLAAAVALALAGGVAVAAYQVTRGDYADVVKVEPVTEPVDLHARVIQSSPVTQMTNTAREVCEDQEVHYASPESRDPNRITGTVAGAVIGGAVGNQVGRGSGRRIATIAGAAGGAIAGREIQERQQQSRQRVETRTEQVCRTQTQPREQIIGYDVTYELDGQFATIRTEAKPGDTLPMGQKDEIVGYEVTYRLDGELGTVFSEVEPGSRLPVHEGMVMVPVRGQ